VEERVGKRMKKDREDVNQGDRRVGEPGSKRKMCKRKVATIIIFMAVKILSAKKYKLLLNYK
jgi:hypothetical protein